LSSCSSAFSPCFYQQGGVQRFSFPLDSPWLLPPQWPFGHPDAPP
jgi:hypothetical protein